jgi:hypothetical protein
VISFATLIQTFAVIKGIESDNALARGKRRQYFLAAPKADTSTSNNITPEGDRQGQPYRIIQDA